MSCHHPAKEKTKPPNLCNADCEEAPAPEAWGLLRMPPHPGGGGSAAAPMFRTHLGVPRRVGRTRLLAQTQVEGAASLGQVINGELLGSNPTCLKTNRPFYVQSADS